MTDGLRSHLRRHLVAYLALGVAFAALGGAAYSAIPDPQGVIHGCYNARGALRVIDTATAPACETDETALNWNQQGPAGAPGAAGPVGPTGPAGADGVATTYGRSRGGPFSLPVGTPKTLATITVPGGDYAIFGKALGFMNVPQFSCDPGTDVYYCNLLHNERRLAATMFGCTVEAGASSDLGRANLIAGANSLSAAETVSAIVVHRFAGAVNQIRMRCLQYGGGKWPVTVSNLRLVAMRVDLAEDLSSLAAVPGKIIAPTKKPKLKPLRKVVP